MIGRLEDTSPMPFGLHKGTAMINVPASYLLWLLKEGKCNEDVRYYILDNKDVLEAEIKKGK